MESFWQDLRMGVRMLRKHPGFSAIAAIALALGIGANTTVFSAVNAVVLRPLPYKDPDRLVMLWGNHPKIGHEAASAPDFADWRAQSTSFERMGALAFASLNITGGADPERVIAARMTADVFPLLGTPFAAGRAFDADEDAPGAGKVAVLSYGLWQRRYGGDPAIVGSKIEIDSEPYTVVGVTAEDFQLPTANPEVFAPLALEVSTKGRRADFLTVLGKLKPGVAVGTADAEMKAIAGRLTEQYPDSNANWSVDVVPLHEQLVGDVRPALLVLLGAVGFLLLIACANVANLLLARAAVRQREIAIRTALGAGRGRLVRQLLVESLPLSLLGGGAGLLLAVWGTDGLLALSPPGVPRLNETSVDLRVLAFTLGLSLLSVTLFALAPALSLARAEPQDTLKEGSSGAGDSRRRLRGALVAAQTGLALVLLVGTGLMIHSFVRLRSVDPGFDPSGLLTMRLSLPDARYKEPARKIDFYDRLLARVSAMPGVRSASAAYVLPVQGGGPFLSFQEQDGPQRGSDEVVDANVRVVGPDYFRTMGIATVEGDSISGREAADAPKVLVVNRTMAHKYWGDASPIGKRIAFESSDDGPNWREIVGVVEDVRHEGLDADEPAATYIPYAQRPAAGMALVLRADADAGTLAAAVREEVRALDPALPVYSVRTMDEILARSVAPRRFGTWLLGVFGGVALALAAVGIYGVMSYSVAQRTREIGIRMALGANRKDVTRLVLREGMRMAIAGLAAGALLAGALAQFLTSMLFDVSPVDPLAFGLAAAVLVFVALLACLLPARRAVRVDPMVALRYE